MGPLGSVVLALVFRGIYLNLFFGPRAHASLPPVRQCLMNKATQ
jgi:hypothetical protein